MAKAKTPEPSPPCPMCGQPMERHNDLIATCWACNQSHLLKR